MRDRLGVSSLGAWLVRRGCGLSRYSAVGTRVWGFVGERVKAGPRPGRFAEGQVIEDRGFHTTNYVLPSGRARPRVVRHCSSTWIDRLDGLGSHPPLRSLKQVCAATGWEPLRFRVVEWKLIELSCSVIDLR